MDSNLKTLIRIVKMLRPWRGAIISANLLHLIGTFLAILSLLAAFPFFELIFSPDSSLYRESKDQKIESPIDSDNSEENNWLLNLKNTGENSLSELKSNLKTKIQANPVQSLYIILSVILGAAILRILILSIVNLIVARVEASFVKNLTYKLYLHIIYHDRIFFSHQPLGKLLTRISVDMFKIRTLIELAYISTIQYPLQIILLLSTLFIIKFELAVYSLVLLPLVLIPGLILSKKVRSLSMRELGFDAGFMDILEEQFSGQEAIKAMRGEENEITRFKNIADETFNRRQKRTFLVEMGQPLQEVLSTLAAALFIFFGIYLVFDTDRISGPVFLYFFITLAYLHSNVKKLLSINIKIQKPLVSAGAIFKTLDKPRRNGNGKANEPFPLNWKEICITDLGFRYNKNSGTWVFRDLNLSIQRHTAVALSGPNGSGKSTLAAIVAGFYHPQKGSVSIGGHNISNIDFDDYRKNVGYISQNAIIFNLSVAQNIAFGVPVNEIDYGRIYAVIRKMHMEEFINSLPQKLDTICGFKGGILSGGQRQLLAFCRALYFNHPVLLIDEPTSSLDSTMVQKVLEVISELKREKTILLITHNEKLSKLADKTVTVGSP